MMFTITRNESKF